MVGVISPETPSLVMRTEYWVEGSRPVAVTLIESLMSAGLGEMVALQEPTGVTILMASLSTITFSVVWQSDWSSPVVDLISLIFESLKLTSRKILVMVNGSPVYSIFSDSSHSRESR